MKHSIVITVPDRIYKDIQAFKKEHFFLDEAAACRSLIVRALFRYYLNKRNTKVLSSGADQE